MAVVSEKQLRYLEYANRENSVRHHTYHEEMLQYQLLKNGDERAIEESVRMWESGLPGHIVDDPVRNMRYLCVASVTLATRFAIEGGMDTETAYNASDLYIQKIDGCRTIEEMRAVHKDMFAFFTHKTAESIKTSVFSKPVIQCMDYIYYHLHEKITVAELAEYVGLYPSYLSTLFAREAGISISEYVLGKRIETAKNMLKFSEFSYSEIAATLAFSSQSHFTKVFREKEGITPKVYRDRYFQIGSIGAAGEK
ncbi:MAG: helix-turn-helix domain-containing protein [Butyrivibrio sp.]|nr:helix-turn-helix domain-containing protein [Butyrivibrio sp.]